MGGPGPTGSPTTQPPQNTSPPPAASGGNYGWFEVDGERFDVDEIYRCPGFPSDRESRYRAGGLANVGTTTNILEVNSDLDDPSSVGITYMFNITTRQYTAEMRKQGDGWVDFDGEPMPGATFALEGSRLLGTSVRVDQEWPENQTGSVIVNFDIEFPSQLAERC